jgi:hypothetical protein
VLSEGSWGGFVDFFVVIFAMCGLYFAMRMQMRGKYLSSIHRVSSFLFWVLSLLSFSHSPCASGASITSERAWVAVSLTSSFELVQVHITTEPVTLSNSVLSPVHVANDLLLVSYDFLSIGFALL